MSGSIDNLPSAEKCIDRMMVENGGTVADTEVQLLIPMEGDRLRNFVVIQIPFHTETGHKTMTEQKRSLLEIHS